MNYWPRYVGDIQLKTGHLTLAEMGAYDRLLDHVYGTEHPLPGTVDACCRIARSMSKMEREAAREAVAQAGKALKLAKAEGVTIAFGTDAGVFEHGRNAGEFALMVDWGGMTPREALAIAQRAGKSRAVALHKRIDRIANVVAVPAAIELGYHLCYGSPADEHMVLPKDAGIMVELTNAVVARVLAGEIFRRRAAGFLESGLEHEIFRRIASEIELGEHDKVSPLGGGQQFRDPFFGIERRRRYRPAIGQQADRGERKPA